MSLNFDLTAIDRRFWHADEATEEAKEVTNTMIWATIAVDMGSITEKNADEFAERLEAYQQLRGALMQKYVDGEIIDRPLTAEEVRERIGLKTNVTTTTKRQFKAKLARLEKEAARA
jgi:hypothetical protein